MTEVPGNSENKVWSLLDIFNTKWLSKNNFVFLMSNMFSILEKQTWETLFDRNKAECTPEGIKHINIILNESLSYYTNYLLRTIGPSFVKKRNKNNNSNAIELNNTKEVRDFFSHSTNKKNPTATKQIHCSLLKIAYAINDIKTHEKEINKIEEEFWKVKEKMFFNNFLDNKWIDIAESLNNNEDNFRYIKLQTKCEKTNSKPIMFTCAWRVKRKDQILVKEISDPKYDSMWAIHDIYGIRNEVTNPEDALFLLEYIWVHIANKKGEISYKNIFWPTEDAKEFIKSYASELYPEFYIKLYNSLDNDKKHGNKKYKDIKLRTKIAWHNTEIQINLVDNKNETGYAHHLIFDCKKKIRALSRLQGYIPHSIVHRYIRNAIEKSIEEAEKYWWKAELVWLGGYHWSIKKITEEHIKKAENKIFDYLLNKEQDIVKLNIPWANNNLNYYTSRSNRNYFHKEKDIVSLYPKGAKARDITTNERTDKEIKET